IECVGPRLSENTGAELEENAPGFHRHAELLHKPENESAQKQFPRYASAMLNSSIFDGSRMCHASGLLLASVFARARRLQSLTNNLRNSGLGEFGKCRNHAVG